MSHACVKFNSFQMITDVMRVEFFHTQKNKIFAVINIGTNFHWDNARHRLNSGTKIELILMNSFQDMKSGNVLYPKRKIFTKKDFSTQIRMDCDSNMCQLSANLK
jgi:hypothetical protein